LVDDDDDDAGPMPIQRLGAQPPPQQLRPHLLPGAAAVVVDVALPRRVPLAPRLLPPPLNNNNRNNIIDMGRWVPRLGNIDNDLDHWGGGGGDDDDIINDDDHLPIIRNNHNRNVDDNNFGLRHQRVIMPMAGGGLIGGGRMQKEEEENEEYENTGDLSIFILCREGTV
jgi:hypothetical protein